MSSQVYLNISSFKKTWSNKEVKPLMLHMVGHLYKVTACSQSVTKKSQKSFVIIQWHNYLNGVIFLL